MFWEDQIINKPNVIKHIIKSKLGLLKHIDSNECIISNINDDEVILKFINNNSLQQYQSCDTCLGLYNSGELVSIMTFKKTDENWEIINICDKLGYNIEGNVNSLIDYFIKSFSPELIIYYDSLDINMFNCYRFEEKEILESVYFIDKDMNRYDQEPGSFRYKIYNCGKIKYVLNLKK